MCNYVIMRFFNGLLVLIGVMTVTFFIARVIPSDPAAKWVGPRATAEQKAAAALELGLDKPLYVQYFHYVTDLLHGNLGRSLNSRRNIAEELRTYLPATFELVFSVFFRGRRRHSYGNLFGKTKW